MSKVFLLRIGACGVVALAIGLVAGAQQTAQPPSDPPAQSPPAPSEPESNIGRTVRITMVSGERISGVLVDETEEAIVVRIAGVDSKINREHIDRMTVERPAADRYREMRQLIADDDIERRLILIDWMRAEGLLDDAQREIVEVLEIEPANGDALRLRRLIEEQITLRDRADTGAEPPLIPPRAPVRDMRRPRAGEFPVVTPEQVNLVKLLEINLDDPPRLVIERDTIDRLILGNRGKAGIPLREADDQTFRRLPAHEILRAMFDVRARDLYSEVTVLDLPESLRLFRDHVNASWLVNGCATTACHGGFEAGDFLLHSRAPTSEQSLVTNLLILDRYRTSDGRGLIDYARPEQSLLLQLALTPKLSSSPHPEVRGFRPVFLSPRSRRYAQTVQWIETMHLPRPDYMVDYQPPTLADLLEAPDAPRDPAEEPPDR